MSAGVLALLVAALGAEEAGTEGAGTEDAGTDRAVTENAGTEGVSESTDIMVTGQGGPTQDQYEDQSVAVRERIAAVDFRASPGEDRGALRAAAGLFPDMPFSGRSVRDALRALHNLGRFSSISAWKSPERPGWVRLTFDLLPRRRVVDVRVEGAVHVTEVEIKRQINILPGADFRQDIADAAAESIRALFTRAGYRSAEVVADVRGEPDLELVYTITEGPPTRIAQLDLEGPLPLPEARLTEALGLEAGDVLALPLLEGGMDSVRQHLRQAGYWRARVGPPDVIAASDESVGVMIPIAAGPRMSFRFRGNASFPDALMEETLGYTGEDPLDTPVIGELAERLQRFYELEGFARAEVTSREITGKNGGEVLVVFTIDEGPLLTITRVDFPGAKHFKAKQLERVIQVELERQVPGTTWVFGEGNVVADPVGSLDPAHLDLIGVSGRLPVPRLPRFRGAPHEVWSQSIYQAATQRIADLYKGEGYLSAKAGPATLVTEPGGRKARVEIPVEEGVRTFVESVTVQGADALSEEVAAAIRLKAGDPMAQYAIEESRVRILQAYSAKGYLYARAEDVEIISEDRTSATVQYNVIEGPQVHIGEIVFKGIARTQPFVVSEYLTFKTGDVYDPAVVQKCQLNLLRLGIFRAVAIGPVDPEIAAEVKDVLVQVREGDTRSADVVVDVSTAEGPRLFGNYNEANIGGLALDMNFSGKFSYDVFDAEVRKLDWYDGLERRLDLGLRYPRFHALPVDLGGRFDLIHERDNRPAYGLTRVSGIGGLDYVAGRELTASLAAELEFDRFLLTSDIESLIDSASQTERQSARLPQGDLILASLRPALTLDLRDNPTHTTEGILATASVEYAKDLLAVGKDETPFVVHFIKLAAMVTGYIPLPLRSVLALSARAGRVFPQNDASVTIGPKRFYLGGSTSIRGFGEDALVPEDRREVLHAQVTGCQKIITQLGCPSAASRLLADKPLVSEGGDVFVSFKGELRVPLAGAIEVGLFMDAGNLWLHPESVAFKLRPAAGAGLRFSTPIGSMALDVGFNLDQDVLLNEELFKIHFFIGLF